MATAEANTIPIVYSVADAAIENLKQQFTGLELTVSEPKGYQAVTKAIATTRSLRGEVEDTRVMLKKDALEYGRRVDAEAKRLTSLLLEIEEPLKAAKKAVDDAAERERVAKIEAEKAKIEAEIKAQRDAEAARIKAEQDAIAEKNRIEREALEAERKKRDAERAEKDRIRREELAKAEAAAKIERDKLRAEQEKLDAERRKIEAERQAAERAEFERQAKIKAECEAKERAERERIAAEQRKVEQERQAAAERARVEALRPDREKIAEWANQLRAIYMPDVKTGDAIEFVVTIKESIIALAHVCDTFAEGK